MENKRIVITYPISLGVPGGSPVDCLQTARYLKAAGAEVMIVSVQTVPGVSFPRLPLPMTDLDREREAQLRAEGIELLKVSPNLLHSWFDAFAIRRLIRSILQNRRIDLVLGYWIEASFLYGLLRSHNVLFGMIAAAPYTLWFKRKPLNLSALLKEKKGSRSIINFLGSFSYRVCFRNSFMVSIKRLPRRLLIERPLHNADLIFTRSNFTRTELADLFDINPEKVSVAYCGIDNVFSTIERKRTKKISRFIYFGALIHEKGIFDAVRAFARVAAQGYNNWSFKIIGWGDKERIRQQVTDSGIASNVDIADRMNHQELACELQQAHVAILPTYAESFGLAIAEAQASGLPVISYRAGAVPEVIVDQETGWLIPVGRIDLIAEAIIEALTLPDKTLRMGLAGRERISSLFSWDWMAERMLQEIKKNSINGDTR